MEPLTAIHAVVSLLRSGDRERAREAYTAQSFASVSDPDARHLLGLIATELGLVEEAEAHLRAAVACAPSDPAFHNNLGLILKRRGRLAAARDELERAASLAPGMPEAHANLGQLRSSLGELERGEADLRRALALRPDYPDALCNLGVNLRLQDRDAEARAAFESALRLDPGMAEAHANLARLLLESEELQSATASARQAIRLAPAVAAHWFVFARCLGAGRFVGTRDPALRDDLVRAVTHSALDPSRFRPAILSYLRLDPALAALLDPETDPVLAPAEAVEALNDPLLLALLRQVIVPDRGVERLITAGRRHALLRLDGAAASAGLPLETLCAFACQCFLTEYAYYESPDESDAAQRLLTRVAAAIQSGSLPASELATLACYRSLEEIADLASTAARRDARLAPLLALQVDEPREEAGLRAAVTPVRRIQDEVSRRVRAQYETRPYPRWTRVSVDEVPLPLDRLVATLFPWERMAPIDQPEILVAGCGTGRAAVATALRVAGAHIVAVDLSVASLAYALRKTRALAVTGIEYRQVDLLELDARDGGFDLIDCSGVLHHLADPLSGWRRLTGFLRPGGLMRVGLYSALARAPLERARALARANGVSAAPADLRRFRQRLLSANDPALAAFTGGEDFYSLSGFVDLVLHVQEQCFTLPEIAACLRELGLRFLGFEPPDRAVVRTYRERFPDDIRMTDLENWHAFEVEHPQTFSRMYQLWLRKEGKR